MSNEIEPKQHGISYDRYSGRKIDFYKVNNISKTFKIFKNKRSRFKNIFGINKESNYIEEHIEFNNGNI